MPMERAGLRVDDVGEAPAGGAAHPDGAVIEDVGLLGLLAQARERLAGPPAGASPRRPASGRRARTRSGTAVRRTAAAIESFIRRERIGPGGRLPTEHALARRFRVSRPIVREAIQSLRVLGVVESRPRTGLRVLPFDPASLFDHAIPRIATEAERAELYAFRCLVETGNLPLVLARAPRAGLERLEAMLRRPLPPGPAGAREGLARDLAFHEALWRLGGNRFVWGLRGLLLRFFADLETRRGAAVTAAVARKTNAEHLAIVRALAAGRLERARKLMAWNLGTYKPGT